MSRVLGGPLSYLWFPGHGDIQPIAMLTAHRRTYLDDSGSWQNDDFVLSVAGAVAPLDKWGEFETAWQPWWDELKQAGIPGLHMRELIHTDKITKERKREIVNAMMRLLTEAGARPMGTFAFALRVGMTDEEWAAEEEPYYKAFRNTLLMGIHVTAALPPEELLHVTIAQKPKYIGGVHRIYEEFRAAYPRLAPVLSSGEFAKDVAGLQAADLIANTLFWSVNRTTTTKFDWLYYDVLVEMVKLDPYFAIYPGTRMILNPDIRRMP